MARRPSIHFSPNLVAMFNEVVGAARIESQRWCSPQIAEFGSQF
ncbi:MAG: hypothetical protein AB8B96_21015 [Lysobacterales bacterium]